MTEQRTGPAVKTRHPRGAILERLIHNLLKYTQGFITRHGLRYVTVLVKFHQGRVKRVIYCYSVPFPPPARCEHDSQSTAAGSTSDDRTLGCRSLSLEEICNWFGWRLDRLLRHFGIGYGVLQIEVDHNGAISKVLPLPSFTPEELMSTARLLSALAQQEAPRGCAMTVYGVRNRNRRRRLQFPHRGRRNRGVLA